MLSIAVDVLAAGIVPLFFVTVGLMYMAFAVYDVIKKNRRK
jgi:hypothetical protein